MAPRAKYNWRRGRWGISGDAGQKCRLHFLYVIHAMPLSFVLSHIDKKPYAAFPSLSSSTSSASACAWKPGSVGTKTCDSWSGCGAVSQILGIVTQGLLGARVGH